MKKFYFALFVTFVAPNIFSQDISGEWFRNSYLFEAELKINNDMTFSIDARRFANTGYMEGVITKIAEGHFVSNIIEVDARTTITFIIREKYRGNKIEVFTEGDWRYYGGHGVYFEGIYERRQTPIEEHISESLEFMFENIFDVNIVKQILKNDSEYFLQCFGARVNMPIESGVIIQGWLPGVAPWQNGIIKIENNNIYILLTDCRRDRIVFSYYTNDIFSEDIPSEFRSWHYFDDQIEIITNW
jgi:hypothetical protein